ncbi:type II secretion system F family protein [Gemmatimonas sp.]|jgi:tight adherence protein C|uniref:type II secretion system F family protein n=1 Tax=Gemmatimonas sp. TaxID=1962908 RepID=UPI0037BE2BBC
MPTSLILLVLVIALATAVAAWAVQTIRRRQLVIDRATEGGTDGQAERRILLSTDKADRAERVQDAVESMLPAGFVADGSTGRMIRAGFESPAAPALYAVARVASALTFPALALLIAPRDDQRLFLLSVAIGVALGLMFPPFLLGRMQSARKRRILRSVPDCLDLLLVCVEAGVSLDAALLRVGREMQSMHPELSEELLVVNRKSNAGMRREDALHGLYDRTGVDELRTLSSTMIQSERWGASIGRVLRVYSESLRRKRRQAAEKKAATAATKMMFPMALFILPALLTIIGGPMALGLGPVWDAMGQ